LSKSNAVHLLELHGLEQAGRDELVDTLINEHKDLLIEIEAEVNAWWDHRMSNKDFRNTIATWAEKLEEQIARLESEQIGRQVRETWPPLEENFE
jgi:hypothetical protein